MVTTTNPTLEALGLTSVPPTITRIASNPSETLQTPQTTPIEVGRPFTYKTTLDIARALNPPVDPKTGLPDLDGYLLDPSEYDAPPVELIVHATVQNPVRLTRISTVEKNSLQVSGTCKGVVIDFDVEIAGERQPIQNFLLDIVNGDGGDLDLDTYLRNLSSWGIHLGDDRGMTLMWQHLACSLEEVNALFADFGAHGGVEVEPGNQDRVMVIDDDQAPLITHMEMGSMNRHMSEVGRLAVSQAKKNGANALVQKRAGTLFGQGFTDLFSGLVENALRVHRQVQVQNSLLDEADDLEVQVSKAPEGKDTSALEKDVLKFRAQAEIQGKLARRWPNTWAGAHRALSVENGTIVDYDNKEDYFPDSMASGNMALAFGEESKSYSFWIRPDDETTDSAPKPAVAPSSPTVTATKGEPEPF